MDVTITPYNHCDLVKLAGRLDSDTVPEVEEPLTALTEAGRCKIVLDMSEVSFVSSKGWWLLIGVQKTCKRFSRGEVVLVCLADRIQNSLNIVGMKDYFRLFEDITDAVGYF
jgi:anti-anti-sigma factor